MKRFVKRLWYGIEYVFIVPFGVFLETIVAVSFFCEISELSGWVVALYLVSAIIAVIMAISCLISIGKDIEEYKQLKEAKEREDVDNDTKR